MEYLTLKMAATGNPLRGLLFRSGSVSLLLRYIRSTPMLKYGGTVMDYPLYYIRSAPAAHSFIDIMNRTYSTTGYIFLFIVKGIQYLWVKIYLDKSKFCCIFNHRPTNPHINVCLEQPKIKIWEF